MLVKGATDHPQFLLLMFNDNDIIRYEDMVMKHQPQQWLFIEWNASFIKPNPFKKVDTMNMSVITCAL